MRALALAVLELAVVHDADHGGLGERRDLDQVDLGRLGLRQGVDDADDAELLALETHEPHLRGRDFAIDALMLVVQWKISA